MKKIIFLLVFLPFLAFGGDKIPSKIKLVTVYLNSAEVSRLATFDIQQGTSELIFTGLSSKIDESSIQVSGLQGTSILAISFDINYLDKSISDEETKKLTDKIEAIELQATLLKNLILGLEEEEKVINTNRLVSADNQSLDIEKIKQISTYYRERITAIKNEIYHANLKINVLNADIQDIQKQSIEINNTVSEPKGEIKIKFDAPISAHLNLELKYNVQDAGWIPNYDIKSKKINDPLKLIYKAHVYQKTGVNWDNVLITLSTGNPNKFSIKPELTSDYLNFGRRKSYKAQEKKSIYNYNPTVRTVTGIVTDESGQPLPGCNVILKGTNIGVQTDFDGRYAINISIGKELVFSYIGFKSNEVPIYSSVMNTRLQEDAQMLEEVVVTGYATADSDFSRALSGKVAGVQIRGTSSVQETQLLYIIDGIPVEDFTEGDLDINEIQNIEVLKDEATTSIYGSRTSDGVILITTKKSDVQDGVTSTKFEIKKPYSISSDGDITAIEINTYQLDAKYEFFTAPVINENVFLTATFTDWEKLNLLPGEANIYFDGGYAGKTAIDPYTMHKEMTVSLGIDDAISINRKQDRNFKSKSFTGSNRILDRTYNLEIKNNKTTDINLVVMDRIPISQNKEIKVDDIITNNAIYNKDKGLLTWKLNLKSKQELKESFSFQIKYPKGRNITL
tara:strand:- start:62023 stop:64056 length:2034 start_codon:yes stop_codon:yes gene_type:complete